MKVQLDKDGPARYTVAGETFEPGDVKDVSDGLAETLLEKPHFSEPETGTGTDETDADAEAFDADEWLDQDYGTRADRVEAGDVDEHLDEIAEVETSDTVSDAIGVRRAELEE
ncbi:hypothetical protein [Halostella sp. PRR32]|uniref:hypothetical protein n=1 Tax=Halostella sp. PRR32 TaxID=3098147 RepID=UPI002B1D1A2A|nr:hypothetical protein [Halostella sp. PRR32]